jgi:hypothetical protein
MPGIISAEIKSLNRGSLEKAFIKIKAQNRQQLDILDVLYMRLGYTVLLEWGNSLYTDNGVSKQVVRNTAIEDHFFKYEGKRSYLDFLGLLEGENLIEDYRIKYSGNCDGMLAVISNFSWTFNPDGSYDIDLTLISLGDVIESLKTNLSVNNNFRTFINNNITNNPEVPIIENNKDLNSINTMLWLFTAFGETQDAISIDGQEVGKFLKRGPSTATNKKGTYEIWQKGISSKEFTKLDNQEFTSLDPDENAKQYLIQKFHSVGDGKYSSIEESPSKNTTKGYVISGNDKKLILTYSIPYRTTVYTQNSIPGGGVAGTGGGYIREEVTRYNVYQIYYKRISLSTEDPVDNPIKDAPYHVAFKLNTTTKNYYLRFDYLLQFIQENIIPEIVATPSNAPLFNIDYDRWGSFMYSLPNQISLDPSVCLVRNNVFTLTTKTAKVLPEGSIFRLIDNGKSTNKNAAYPLSIYLNFQFIISSLKNNQNDKGDVNLYGFISSLCTGLNKALGGINNLEPVINKDSNTLTIIDSTPIPGITAPEDDSYKLMLYGYKGTNYDNDYQSYTTYESNFIRNIDLKTTITPDYATMVTVGATANGYVKGTEATAFSVWNKGIVDRFKYDLISPSSNTTQTTTSGSNEAETNYVNEYLAKRTECYGFNGNLYGTLGDIDADIVGKNISIVTEFYKYLIAKNSKKTIQAGTIGFIPFKLGITMDGISGIKIYNKLNVNSEFLPTRYGETLNFIITGVNHRLQNNDWETNLDTIVMPKTSKIEELDIDFTQFEIETTSTPPVTGSDADFWALLAICALEDGDPQGRADVAQSIYNRLQANLAGVGYGGKSLKQIIVAKNQYQPAFLNINKGSLGIAPQWKNIKDKNTAIAAIQYYYSQRGQNESYFSAENKLKDTFNAIKTQQRRVAASTFVLNRTDFRAPTQKDDLVSNTRVQRKSGDNYYGFNKNGTYRGKYGQGSPPIHIITAFALGSWPE